MDTGQEALTGLTTICIIALAVLAFILPRRYALAPFVISMFFIPADQRTYVFELDFTALRILILAGVLRVLLRGELRDVRWNSFDKILIAWILCRAAVYTIQGGNMPSLIWASGQLFEALGFYWLFRQTIRSWEDVKFILKTLAVCCLALLPFVLYEKATAQNPFSLLGRVWTDYRQGRFRCQASFPHPLMLGSVAGALPPLFIALAMAKGKKALWWAATGAAVLIVYATASSGPVATLAGGMFVFVIFKYRKYGRHVAIGLLAMAIGLHIVMEAPVWHLIARVNIVAGSTGWHRYHLINETVNHFSEWAWLGTRSTAHWGWGLYDVTNQYALEAVRGGLATLVLFVLLLIRSVRIAGRTALRNIPSNQQWLAWGIACSIIAHCVSFTGVSYFGQIMMLLYLTFAVVGTLEEIQGARTLLPVTSLSRKALRRVPHAR